MCQDEDENEDEHQSFGSFWNLCMTNEPILQCIIVLRAWFVRHSLYPERTKKFVFGFVFVFVLAHEQPISAFLPRLFFVKQSCFCFSTFSKGSSGRKEKCTQFLTPSFGTVFHALSHGVIHFGRSVRSRNHFLIGSSSSTANQKLPFQGFYS